MRARARPNLAGEPKIFVESYSADKVMSEFGLHARWHWKAALPSSLNRVFKTVFGSIDCEVPMVNLFSEEDNL